MSKTDQTDPTNTDGKAKIASVKTAQVDIKDLIYMICDKQVIINNDQAMLYQLETKRLNEAVKCNVSGFAERSRYRLTNEEYVNLKSQITTSM